MFERVLVLQLAFFLIEHIPPNQFGFLPGTGALDIGVILADPISRALEARKDVRLVVLDFKGAFDKVWWWGLLAHLWAVGVRSKAYQLFFESYHVPIGQGPLHGGEWADLRVSQHQIRCATGRYLVPPPF